MKLLLKRAKVILKQKISPATLEWIKKIIGSYKFDEVDLIYNVLADKINSKIMIDVGAHYGESFSSFLFDKWDVYAFEPDNENMKILSFFSNSKGKLVLDKRGCSNKSAKSINFFSSVVSSGISSLSPFHNSHILANKIDTVTIADYVEEQKIKEIGFLKIDTEGHDFFVLQGMPWGKVKPEVIVCEFEDSKTKKLGYTYNEMANFLKEKKYYLLVSEWDPIVEYGQRHKPKKLHEYPCTLINNNAWGNIIAFSNKEFYKLFLESTISGKTFK